MANQAPPAPSSRTSSGLPPGVGGLIAFLVYSALALIFFGRALLGRFSTTVLGRGPDPTTYLWSFRWWSYAHAHGLDPFITRAIWAPTGVNLAWTTAMPTAARIAQPLTSRVGPAIPYNIFCLACPALAAWAGFLLCHRFARRFWPALLGGYLFGFSSYMLGQTRDHLVLQSVFPVALAVLLVVNLVEGARRRRWLWVVPLAIVLALQFGLALEIFATMTFFGAIAAALWYAFDPARRAQLRAAIPPVVVGYLLALAIQWNYVYHLFFFGRPAGGFNSPTAFSADLLNFILPTPTLEWGRWGLLSALSTRFSGNRAEAGACLGLLLIPFALWMRSNWRMPAARALLWTLVIVVVAALGPRLHVAGWVGPGMPWKAFIHLPLIRNALPARFCVYSALIVALVVALYFGRELTLPGAALLAAIVLTSVPNLSPAFWSEPLATPAFFTDGLYRNSLRPGETVVALPYGIRGRSMLWQEASDMYFRMAGGYAGTLVPPEFARWPVVDALYHDTAIPDLRVQLFSFMAAHRAEALLVSASAQPRLAPLLTPLGIAPTHSGGILIYRIDDDELAAYRGADPSALESRCVSERFNALLRAGAKYLRRGGNLNLLTPMVAQRLGLIPPAWTRDADVRTGNGLFLGPFGKGQIAVGVNAPYAATAPLLARYGPQADAVYFPYPRKLDRARHTRGVRMFVMVFDRAALMRAAAIAGSIAPLAK